MKKKISFILALVLALTLVLAGCGGGNDKTDQKTDDKSTTDQSATDKTDTDKQESETDKEEKSENATTDADKAFNIVIVTSPSGVDDGSFNQNNYEGIQNFIKENPSAKVSHVREETGAPDATVQAVADVVANHDIFVLPGFQFAGVSQLALDNPDKKFIMVDATPAPINDQEVFDNILSMTFKEQESGFLGGIAAALESKTGKVAVVTGIAFPSNVNYQYGFMAGVNYANAKYGKNVETVELASYAGTDVTGANVGGNYVGSFADEATGKVVAEALLAEGVDIALVAAGGSGNGVFTAFKESKNDVKVIGVDVDQYDDGVNGSANIVLTSVLKVMDLNVYRALNTIKDGGFTGANILLDATTDSTGIVTKEGRNQLSADSIKILDEVYALIKSQTILPPSNFNGHTPTDFPGLK